MTILIDSAAIRREQQAFASGSASPAQVARRAEVVEIRAAAANSNQVVESYGRAVQLYAINAALDRLGIELPQAASMSTNARLSTLSRVIINGPPRTSLLDMLKASRRLSKDPKLRGGLVDVLGASGSAQEVSLFFSTILGGWMEDIVQSYCGPNAKVVVYPETIARAQASKSESGEQVVALSLGLCVALNRFLNLFVYGLSPTSALRVEDAGLTPGLASSPHQFAQLNLAQLFAGIREDQLLPCAQVRLKPAAQDFKSLVEWSVLAFLTLHEIAHIKAIEDPHLVAGVSPQEVEEWADKWAVRELESIWRRDRISDALSQKAAAANGEVRRAVFSGKVVDYGSTGGSLTAGFIALILMSILDNRGASTFEPRIHALLKVAHGDGIFEQGLDSYALLELADLARVIAAAVAQQASDSGDAGEVTSD